MEVNRKAGLRLYKIRKALLIFPILSIFTTCFILSLDFIKINTVLIKAEIRAETVNFRNSSPFDFPVLSTQKAFVSGICYQGAPVNAVIENNKNTDKSLSTIEIVSTLPTGTLLSISNEGGVLSIYGSLPSRIDCTEVPGGVEFYIFGITNLYSDEQDKSVLIDNPTVYAQKRFEIILKQPGVNWNNGESKYSATIELARVPVQALDFARENPQIYTKQKALPRISTISEGKVKFLKYSKIPDVELSPGDGLDMTFVSSSSFLDRLSLSNGAIVSVFDAQVSRLGLYRSLATDELTPQTDGQSLIPSVYDWMREIPWLEVIGTIALIVFSVILAEWYERRR